MKYSAQELLKIAKSINIPNEPPNNSPGWSGNVTFGAKNDWKVIVFYDCGELDYIDSFITPSGEIIDFWNWPDEPDFFNSDKNMLMCWTG